MENDGFTKTTIGIYLRACRVVWNECTQRGFLGKKEYPFGKDKSLITIPVGSTRKKEYLNVEQMTELYQVFIYKKYPESWQKSYIEKVHFSLGLFLVQYLCNGFNLADAALQERFYTLWKILAARYGGAPELVAFELLNEIIEPEVAEAWNQIALHAIAEIRVFAPESWIIFGGVMYNNVLSVPMLAEVNDPKVAYTFHSYEPLIFTHQGAYWVDGMPSDFRIAYPNTIENYRESSKMLSQELAGAIFEGDLPEVGPAFFEALFQPALKIAEERDIPLYCGEYGVIDLADNVSKINWASDICAVFDKYGIGRAYWNYKEKDYGIVNIPDQNVQRELAAKL